MMSLTTLLTAVSVILSNEDDTSLYGVKKKKKRKTKSRMFCSKILNVRSDSFLIMVRIFYAATMNNIKTARGQFSHSLFS